MASRNYRADASHAGFNDTQIECSDGTFSLGILDGMQGFSVKQSLDMGEEREAGSVFVSDVTTGDYSAEGSADWKAEAWDNFRDKLALRGRGFFGTSFDFTWTYKKKDGKLTTIKVVGARFTEQSRDGKTGTEALKVTVSMKITGRVYENGIDAFGGRL